MNIIFQKSAHLAYGSYFELFPYTVQNMNHMWKKILNNLKKVFIN
jgi:hypothetical protein